MAKYTPAQLQGAIIGAITTWEKNNNTSIDQAWGFDKSEIARTLYQIAQAESGGTNDIGDTHIKNPDNNASYSPWQINKQHTSQVKAGKQYDHTKLTNDPRYAALAAIEIANDATTSSGDAFARYYPWTAHRMTNPNDKGPFQFARGSSAPNDSERANAINAFDSGGKNWDNLDFSGKDYSAYNPTPVSGYGDVSGIGANQSVASGTTKAGITPNNPPNNPPTTPSPAMTGMWANPDKNAKLLKSMWDNPDTNAALRASMWDNPDIDAKTKTMWDNPDAVAQQKTMWDDPDANAKLLNSMWDNPNKNAQVRVAMKSSGSMWDDPSRTAQSRTDEEGLGPIGDTGSIPSWKAPPEANSLQVGNFKEKLRQALDARAQEEYSYGKQGLGKLASTFKTNEVTLSDVDALLRGTGDGALNDAQINSLLKASLGGTDEQSSAAADYLVGDLVRRVTSFERSDNGSFLPIGDSSSMAAGVLNRAALNHNTDPNDRSRDVQNLLGVGETTSDDPERGTRTQTTGFNTQAGLGQTGATGNAAAGDPNLTGMWANPDVNAQQPPAGQFGSGPPAGLEEQVMAYADEVGGAYSLISTDPWTYRVHVDGKNTGIFRMDESGQHVLDVTDVYAEELKGGGSSGQYGSGQTSNTASGYSVRTDPATGNPQHWDSTTNGWKDGPPPNHSTFVNMSGETVIVDQNGKQVGSIGVGFDEFANVRDFGENQRQFNQRLGLDQARFGEDIRQFDTRFGEDVRQFDLGFSENQRQFNTTENRMEKTLAANNYFQGLEELGRNYRTLVQTSPELANAATNQGKLITDILRGGGDVLARTYFTRGGMSPLPEITQADLINNLTDEMAKVQQFEVDATMAENQRRVAADMQRAQDEYGAFRTKREADARSAYQQFVSNMAPVGTQMSDSYDVVDTTSDAYQAAQAAKDAADAKLATFTGIQNVGGMDNYDADTDTFTDPAVQSYYQSAQDMADEAAGAADASNFTTTETNTWMDYSQPTAPAFQDWRGTSRFAGQPTFADWQTNVGQSFANTPMLNVPNTPIPRAVTQEELIAQSRAVSPPAVQSLLSGQMPSPLQFGGLPLPTFQQLQALTPSEQEMLNSRLLTEFNVPLSDVAFQTQRQFSAPSMDRNRDLARFRGYSV